jgi:hypothetical protein
MILKSLKYPNYQMNLRYLRNLNFLKYLRNLKNH